MVFGIVIVNATRSRGVTSAPLLTRYAILTGLIAPGMLVSLVFGCLDGIKVSAFSTLLPAWVERLPLSAQGLAWLPPTLVMLIVAAAYDQTRGRQQISVF